jgi:hypothetical protein
LNLREENTWRTQIMGIVTGAEEIEDTIIEDQSFNI